MQPLTQTCEFPTAVAAAGSAVRPPGAVTAPDTAADAAFAQLLTGASGGAETAEAMLATRSFEAWSTPGLGTFVFRGEGVAGPTRALGFAAERPDQLEILQTDRVDSEHEIEIDGVAVDGSLMGLRATVATAVGAPVRAPVGAPMCGSGSVTAPRFAAFDHALQAATPTSRDAPAAGPVPGSTPLVTAADAAPASAPAGQILPRVPGSELPESGNALPAERPASAQGAPASTMAEARLERVAPAKPKSQHTADAAGTMRAAAPSPSAAESVARLAAHAAARTPARASEAPPAQRFFARGFVAGDGSAEDGIASMARQSLAAQVVQSGAAQGPAGTGTTPVATAEFGGLARADVSATSTLPPRAPDSSSIAHAPVTVSGGTIEAGQLGDRLIALALHGQQQAKLRLHPAELGALEVRIKLHDDGASVAISSPHGQVRDAIEATLPRLRELFAAQGMNLVDVDVSSGGGSAPHGDRESLRHGQPVARQVVGTSDAAPPRPVVGEPVRAPLRTHRIDLLA